MNKFFRVIWSKTLQCMIVVPEVGPARSRTVSERKRRHARAKLSGVSHAVLVSALMASTTAYAQSIDFTLPQNGQVVAGQAQIGASAPGSMLINQSTQRAAINWDSFDIGRDASVEFRQPSTSSVALNRVTGAHPSQIFGQLSANGQVFITNKQGVYFAPGARVDVGGLVATSHSMSDEAFMAGSTEFHRDGATGAVINEGNLTAAEGGYVALLAPEVRNQGVISARMGTVALAAGEAINLEFDEGGSLVNLRVTPAQIDTLIENGHLIKAPGGRVIMSAGAANELRSSIVRNDGRINARAISEVGGRVFLGGGTIKTTARSEIVASTAPVMSKRPMARPQDAEIFISGQDVELAGALDVSGAIGGTVAIEGNNITLSSGAYIDATGLNGGGNVLVGGDWQGGANAERRVFADADAMAEATRVTMAEGAIIDASATVAGDGGTVVLWSDVSTLGSLTAVAGEILAKGGENGGNGGQIETSGRELEIAGARVQAGALHGDGGLWLLDPTDSTIDQTAASAYAATLNTGTDVENLVTGSMVMASNVDIHKSAGGDATLTLKATDKITLSSGSQIRSTVGKLNVVLWANDGDAAGGIKLDNAIISSNGGDITLGGFVNPESAAAYGLHGVDLSNQTRLDAGTGDISIRGESYKRDSYGIGVRMHTIAGLSGHNIYINGMGAPSGGNGNNWGVSMENEAPITASGTLTIVGHGGGWRVTGGVTSGSDHGVYIAVPDVLEGSGGVSITGTAGGNAGSNGNYGVYMIGATLTLRSGAGALTITGKEFRGGGPGIVIDNGATLGSAMAGKQTGDITLRADYLSLPSMSVQGEGALTIEPLTSSNSFSSELNTSGLTLGSALTGLTIGKPGNSAPLTIANDIVLDGPISFESGSFTINPSVDLETTAPGADIRVKVNNYADGPGPTDGWINIYGDNITTNGGDIVLWSNADNLSTGAADNQIYLDGGNTLRSNGGKIVLAGGLDDGGASSGLAGLTAGDGIPDGFAYRGELNSSAIIINDNVSLLSGDGDVIIRGQSGGTPPNVFPRSFGVWADAGFKLDAGTGTINIRGKSESESAIWLGPLSAGTSSIAITSASTAANAITIHGESTSTTGGHGLIANWDGSTGSHLLIESSATSGGGVSITGITSVANHGIILGQTGADESIQILSHAGDVSLISNKGLLIGNDAFLGNRKDGNAVNGITPSVQSSSADILIRANSLDVGVGRAIDVSAAGELTIEPYDNSFSSAYDTSRLTLGSALTGLTIGKSTNTANVTMSNAIDIAGPITVYGGDIAVNENLNTTAGGALGDILLKGSGNIIQASSKSFTTSGGDVTLWADSDDSGAGYIQLTGGSNSGITSGGGNIFLGGGTVLATGYARGAAEPIVTESYTMYIAGVHLRNETEINSGGGNITLRGQNVGNSIDSIQPGIMGIGTTLDAGTGKIALYGLAGGSGSANAQAISTDPSGSGWTIRSASTEADAITLIGDATTTNNSAVSLGINFVGIIEATGNGGGIALTGSSGTSTNFGDGLDIVGDVLAASGTITLTGTDDATNTNNRDVFLNNATLGFKTDTNVISSTANVVVRGNRPAFGSNVAVATSGTFTLESDGDDFTSAVTVSNLTLGAAVSGLTIGKASNTASITINSGQTVAGQITVYGGTIAINGALTATNSTVNLHASGNVTQSAAITASGLGLHGTGDFTLTNTGNSVTTLAGGDSTTKLGRVTFVNAGALSVGTVNPTGITATGDVSISTVSGDLTISENITTDSTSASAITLNAGSSEAAGTSSGGNILLSGSLTTGSGGRIRLFTGSVSGSTGLAPAVGSGSGNFRYNADEGTDFSTGSWTNIGNSGAYGIYREQPTANISNMTLSMTYGEALPAITATGAVNGDGSSYDIAGAAYSTSGYLNASNTPYTITSSLALLGYSVTGVSSGTLTVAAKALTISGLGSADKVYDGTTFADVSGMATLQSTISAGSGTTADGRPYDGDDVSVAGTPVANFNSADVSSATTVSFTGLSLTGADSGNYTLTAHADVAQSITPAKLVARANDDAKFISQADPTFTVSVSGFVNGETSATASGFVSPTVARTGGNTTPGIYSNVLAASGGSADNYTFSYEAGDFTIVPSDQLLVRVTDISETYGSTTQYAITSVQYSDGTTTYTLGSGGVAGSSVSINSANAVSINDGATGTASFTLAAKNASLSNAGKLKVGSYQIGLTGTVTENSDNFSNTITIVGSHLVTTKGLTASASNVSKVYDGTTSMSNVSLDLATLETGDLVSVDGKGAFSDRNVGTGLTYTIANVALSGVDSANYHLSAGTSFTGSNGEITQRPLSVTYTGVDRVYNGVSSASVTTSDDRVSGDILAIQRSASFSDKNVGTGKIVTISGVSLTGADAGNYSVAATGLTTADITRLSSVTWVGGSSGNWFDPANWHGGAVPDLANVASVNIPTGVSVSFDTTGAIAPADASGTVQIDSLGSTGSLSQLNGSLSIGAGGITLDSLTLQGGTLSNAGNTQLSSFAQSGGTFSGAGGLEADQFSQTDGTVSLSGDLTVNQSFAQGTSGSASVGGTTSITDVLGGIVLGNLTMSGVSTINSLGGAITQAAGTAIGAVGATTMIARSSGPTPSLYDIVLDGANNDFQSRLTLTGNNITVNDKDDLDNDVEASGNALVDAGGTLTARLDVDGNSTLTSAGDLSVSGNSQDLTTVTTGTNSTTNFGATTVRGALDVTSTGNVGQTGALTVAGTTTFDAVGRNVVLNNAGNDFGGTVSGRAANVVLRDANTLTLGVVETTGDLNVQSNGALNLGTSTVGGDLTAASVNGDITQTGPLTVTGASDLDAGSGDITLTNSSNDFIGLVSLEGANIALADSNNLSIGDVTVSSTLRLTAGNNITLSGNIATGTLELTALAGAINQPSGQITTASGPTRIRAAGNVALNGSGNVLQGGVDAIAASVSVSGDVQGEAAAYAAAAAAAASNSQGGVTIAYSNPPRIGFVRNGGRGVQPVSVLSVLDNQNPISSGVASVVVVPSSALTIIGSDCSAVSENATNANAQCTNSQLVIAN